MMCLDLLSSQEAGSMRGCEAVAIMYHFIRIMGKHSDTMVMVKHKGKVLKVTQWFKT